MFIKYWIIKNNENAAKFKPKDTKSLWLFEKSAFEVHNKLKSTCPGFNIYLNGLRIKEIFWLKNN
jgi:hypothetical protein